MESDPSIKLVQLCIHVTWTLFWLVILFLAWPVSMFFGGVYGVLAPVVTFLGLDKLLEYLLTGANLGMRCADMARYGVYPPDDAEVTEHEHSHSHSHHKRHHKHH